MTEHALNDDNLKRLSEHFGVHFEALIEETMEREGTTHEAVTALVTVCADIIGFYLRDNNDALTVRVQKAIEERRDHWRAERARENDGGGRPQ